MKLNTWCVPSAIFCATAWMIKQRQQVRISITKIDENTDHSQAEALVDGTWTPLTEIWDGTSMAVIPYQRHFPDAPEPYRYPTLEEFFQEQYEMFRI
jgi:hypothetical protein